MMGAGSVLLGNAVAAIRDSVQIAPLVLSLLFVFFAQICSNACFSLNQLREHRGAFTPQELYQLKERQENLAIYRMLREFGNGALILALTIGIVLANHNGLWAFLLGAAVLLLVYLHDEGPAPLSRTPFGSLTAWLLFGPIGVIGSFLIQTSDPMYTVSSWYDVGPAVGLSVAYGFMAVNSSLTNTYRSYRLDMLTERRTFVTACGRRNTRRAYLLNLLLMWVSCLWMVNTLYFIHPVLDMLPPTLSLAVGAWIHYKMRHHHDSVRKSWNVYTLTLANDLLLALSFFLLFLFIGNPETSIRNYF